jgi:pyruvate/2-oxoglutarate dehydrogenase complex dihydrolipoamide acyltransferase (E2) component
MLSLSHDRRIIDGAQAAGFLKSLKQLLENPVLFLSE